MPATSEKQRKFFGAVMGAKKGKPGSSGKAKEVAKDMNKGQIKDFLTVKAEYAQGFMDKCAAFGIDPEQLIKASAEDSEQLPPGIEPAAKGNKLTNMVASTDLGDAAAAKKRLTRPEYVKKNIVGLPQSERPAARREARTAGY